MSQTVIRIEGISKRYQLGEISSGTISGELSNWWKSAFGNKKTVRVKVAGCKDTRNEIWALRNVYLDVKQGEVLGIIGGNGAGKSTLLKILSRITKPSTGSISVRGRIASLLEVGTGFHPDLTGRENIFLNGAILGMRTSEIRSRLEEIISFAGVETYLDTPVKRYSSGMYVRLAFAVAAHLEPEILVMDEVLAVGDMDFQKKCLGKVKEVTYKQGRTVIFVSHNMDSVKSLCSRAVYLKKGQVVSEGMTGKVIDCYTHNLTHHQSAFYFQNNPTQIASLHYVRISDIQGRETCTFSVAAPWQIKIGFKVQNTISDLIVAIGIVTAGNIPVRTIWSKPYKAKQGVFEAVFYENEIVYAAGTYRIIVSLSRGSHTFQYIDTDIYVVFEEDFWNKEFIKTKDTGLILNQMDVAITQLFG